MMGDVITSKYAHLSEGISNASMSLCRGRKCSDLNMQILGKVLQIRRFILLFPPPWLSYIFNNTTKALM